MPAQTFKCPRCGAPKNAKNNYVRKTGKRAGAFSVLCIICHKKQMVTLKAAQRLREPARVAESNLRSHLKQRFGMSLEEYHYLHADQGGRCAICRDEIQRDSLPGGGAGLDGRAHVDHCHTTGMNRGLLCSRCNLGLGHFLDSPRLLAQAIVYLRRTSKCRSQ